MKPAQVRFGPEMLGTVVFIDDAPHLIVSEERIIALKGEKTLLKPGVVDSWQKATIKPKERLS